MRDVRVDPIADTSIRRATTQIPMISRVGRRGGRKGGWGCATIGGALGLALFSRGCLPSPAFLQVALNKWNFYRATQEQPAQAYKFSRFSNFKLKQNPRLTLAIRVSIHVLFVRGGGTERVSASRFSRNPFLFFLFLTSRSCPDDKILDRERKIRLKTLSLSLCT